MRTVILAAAALLTLAGCSSDPGPSLDQQQQAWEGEVRETSCESIKIMTPGALELEWAVDRLAAGKGTADDLKVGTRGGGRDRPYNCNDETFERFHQEQLVFQFPDSPKGQAGETTAPSR